MQNHKYDGCKEAANHREESHVSCLKPHGAAEEPQVSCFRSHEGWPEEHRLVWPDEQGDTALQKDTKVTQEVQMLPARAEAGTEKIRSHGVDDLAGEIKADVDEQYPGRPDDEENAGPKDTKLTQEKQDLAISEGSQEAHLTPPPFPAAERVFTGSGELRFEAIEPWPERVDGASLLDELEGVMKRFVILPKYAAETVALWCLHTYAFQYRDVSTYLGIESPERRCGKTTLLSLLCKLAHRTITSANISSSAVFRAIEEMQPTLLIDEGDTFLQKNDELLGILNSGYTRETAYVVRVAANKSQGPRPKSQVSSFKAHGREGQSQVSSPTFQAKGEGSKDQSPMSNGSRLVRFSCWCPKVMATIGRLPETLADRCIVIRMQRKIAGEECARLRLLEPGPLKRKCVRFVADHAAAIASARPAVPESLNDRAADVWEPLFVLADLAGGTWPEKARRAAIALSAGAQENSPIGALLSDILNCFVSSDSDRLFSRTMAGHLNQLSNRPWAELRNGKAITELWLSHQLRPYGIRPRTIWIREAQGKGYMQEDFGEVFRRYVPGADGGAGTAD